MFPLFFGTTNEGKLKEAREVLGMAIEGTSLEVEEIQSLDPVKIATNKAQAYFDQLKNPVFIDDVSLTFNALGKLPGTYINDFLKALEVGGLLSLLEDKKDRTATAQTTIAFAYGKGKIETFPGIVEGSITSTPHGTNGFGWDSIFIPKGFTKTYAEMTNIEKNQISSRAIALSKFKDWLKK